MSRISDATARRAAPLLLELVRDYEKNAGTAPVPTSRETDGAVAATPKDAA